MSNGDVTRGLRREMRVPSCALSAQDLLELGELLVDAGKEAADQQVKKTRERIQVAGGIGMSDEELEKTLLEWMTPVVTVVGRDGELMEGPAKAVLEPKALPDKLLRVSIDSAHKYRQYGKGQHPERLFSVILDFSSPVGEETKDESRVVVVGENPTWVTGVYERIKGFLKKRRCRRGWLHVRSIYTVLVIFVGMPLSLLWLARLERWSGGSTDSISMPLRFGLYAYFFVVGLLVFRLGFLYAQWVFPRIQGPEKRLGARTRHRLFWAALAVAWIGNGVDELLKLLAGGS